MASNAPDAEDLQEESYRAFNPFAEHVGTSPQVCCTWDIELLFYIKTP